MIRLGTVIHVTASRRVIVQSNKIPRLGSLVFNDNEKVGIVKDVFGPKAHPFISIVPNITIEKANGLVGKNLFYTENQRKRKSQRQKPKGYQGPRKIRKTRKLNSQQSNQ